MSILALLVACSPATLPDEAAGPTWQGEVAPIITRSCAGCHTAGGVAPFALDTYELASAQADAIVASVEGGRMPPWDAVVDDGCTPERPWKDDPTVTAAELEQLRAWADAGAPEGDPATAAELPPSPELALVDANSRLTPGEAFVTSGDADQFYCTSLDPELTTERWITGLQVLPGNAEVVHHVLIFSDPTGETAKWGSSWQECFNPPSVAQLQLVGAWAPGAPPFRAPDSSGMPISPGTRLIMQVHYHPAGSTGASDLTSIDLRFSDEAPAWEASMLLAGNASGASDGLLDGPNDPAGVPEFLIPANTTDHTETIQYDLSRDTPEVRIFGAGTHMHYIGTGMEIRVGRRNESHGSTDECLIETNWDFNWQRLYYYDTPIEELPILKGGDSLWMQCRYDNTLENPGVVRALSDAGLEAPIDVELGETTLDEMCLGVFGLLVPREE